MIPKLWSNIFILTSKFGRYTSRSWYRYVLSPSIYLEIKSVSELIIVCEWSQRSCLHHDKSRCFDFSSVPIWFVTSVKFHDILQICIYSTVYTQCVRILDACLLLFVFFWDGLLSRFQFIVPLLKLNKSSKVVFYCYFPDLLPAKRKTTLRRLYRKPIDFIEEHTTGSAILCKQNQNLGDVTLTVAGGYDERLKENVEYLEELRSLAEKEGVSEESKLHHILFNRSKNRTSLKSSNILFFLQSFITFSWPFSCLIG